jgi:hypothetical protein
MLVSPREPTPTMMDVTTPSILSQKNAVFPSSLGSQSPCHTHVKYILVGTVSNLNRGVASLTAASCAEVMDGGLFNAAE